MIITDIEQYNNLIERMNREQCILTPIFRDIHYHRHENNVLCVSVSFVDETYIVSVSHPDAPSFHVPDGPHLTAKDVQTLAYVHNLPLTDWEHPAYIKDTYNQFWNTKDVNKLIPLSVWSSALKKYTNKQWRVVNQVPQNETYKSVNNMINTLRQIEDAGLCVNRTLLEEHFEAKTQRVFKHNFVYSEYNPYTITGRPSNRFGGINFSALNKSDGTRDMFISRYEDGCLVQIDFEAYHLRLIADDYQIQLPDTSLHTEFAKIYFDTDTITEELYTESKRKTFEIMYGLSDETYGIDLFKRVVEIRKTYANTNGTITLPSGMTVDVYDPNPSKLFNYYVQSLEVVKTIPKLQQIIDLLQSTSNHLILYTYDSILLDMEQYDTTILHEIVSILTDNKKFPVRVYTGTTYGNISEIRL
jgi:hypothetical protein